MSALLESQSVATTAVTTQPVLYVLKRFPRLSETFILREILGLEAAGVQVMVDALLPPEEGPSHPELATLRAQVRYVQRHPRLREQRVLRAHARLMARHPLRWAAVAGRARRDPAAERGQLEALRHMTERQA